MNRTTPIIIIILIAFALSACAPDPRKQAEADATRIKAEQQALDDQLAREQSADLHQAQMEQVQIEQERREATKKEWQKTFNNAIRFGGYFGVAALCVLIVYATITIKNTMLGMGRAMVEAAEIKANLIHLDPNGSYPAIIRRMGGGRWTLTDLNTRTTMQLDVRNEPDAQMVAGAIAIRHDHALADQARRTNDGGVSIATIQPPIIQRQIIDMEEVARLSQENEA